jgi:hypothetical protein
MITGFPFVITGIFLVAALVAVVIFIVGFSRHGTDFLKHGFRQNNIVDLGTKIDGLRDEVKTELGEFKTELEAIKVNHFGHLKSYLRLLNGILLDKNIVDNTMKARLDNELEGM